MYMYVEPDSGHLDPHQVARARAAARRVENLYSGPLGRLVARELTAYAEFGLRLAPDGLTESLIAQILDETVGADRDGRL